MSKLQTEYGPIFKIPRIGEDPIIVVCDYDSNYQVSVKEGKIFGGRPSNFRVKTLQANTGIVASYTPNETWKSMRKTSQRHLRQFGDGLSRLEDIIMDIAEDMFEGISKHDTKPYDPRQIIFDTALNRIAFLIIGKRTKIGEPVVEKMRQYEALFFQTIPVIAPLHIKMYDVFPWLRHCGLKSWNLFTRTLQLQSDIWQAAKAFSDNNPDVESIYKVFNEQLQSGTNLLTKEDAVKATLSLILAGVATTSTAFTAAINILAHHKHIQDKILNEIQKIQETNGRDPSLQDRPNMDYTRAVLFEVLRYTSPVPASVPHRTTSKSRIKNYDIPENAMILPMLWNLHHDKDVWTDPYSFNPDRFLDKEGKVISADHPYRKNLMPFGAGPRVCLGESLALTRLFLWLVTLVQRFEISPAPGNEMWKCDARHYQFEGVFRPTPYEVIFQRRT